MSLPILLLGGTGQVGIELLRRSPDLVAPSRAALDIENAAAVAEAVGSRQWRAVINCAAYTAVDDAETEIAAAWRRNALAPATLAAETARRDVPLVQVSTDYVFDGAAPAPYRPEDPVAPLNVYGASKLAGEIAVRAANPRHVILRTAWVASAHRSNFVRTMLRLGGERDTLRVVDDQRGNPTSAADLAEVLLAIATSASPLWGTYHFVNAGDASWYDLAREVFAGVDAHGGRTPALEPVATADYPTAARRPANSRLDTASLERDFGIRPRPWQAAIGDIVAELLDGQGTKIGKGQE